MTDPIIVTLPSKEHAQQLMAFLDAAPFKGIKAKRIVVDIMEALEVALKELQEPT